MKALGTRAAQPVLTSQGTWKFGETWSSRAIITISKRQGMRFGRMGGSEQETALASTPVETSTISDDLAMSLISTVLNIAARMFRRHWNN